MIKLCICKLKNKIDKCEVLRIMENHLFKTPGTWEEIDIRCPKCSSNMVSIITNSFGYYEVSECKKCGYRNNEKLIS